MKELDEQAVDIIVTALGRTEYKGAKATLCTMKSDKESKNVFLVTDHSTVTALSAKFKEESEEQDA